VTTRLPAVADELVDLESLRLRGLVDADAGVSLRAFSWRVRARR
jgi:hypothetical protein